jgi:hypothetical protein
VQMRTGIHFSSALELGNLEALKVAWLEVDDSSKSNGNTRPKGPGAAHTQTQTQLNIGSFS